MRMSIAELCMNIEFSEKMKPPKELFSRTWYNDWDISDPWEYRLRRIDETNKKLKNLETKIRNNSNHLTDGTRNLLIDTVSISQLGIGAWNVYSEDTITTNGYVKKTESQFKINMIYRDRTRVLDTWSYGILGDNKRVGVCFVLLSPEYVEWLNKISDCFD